MSKHIMMKDKSRWVAPGEPVDDHDYERVLRARDGARHVLQYERERLSRRERAVLRELRYWLDQGVRQGRSRPLYPLRSHEGAFTEEIVLAQAMCAVAQLEAMFLYWHLWEKIERNLTTIEVDRRFEVLVDELTGEMP